MTTETRTTDTRTSVVGVFENREQAQRAVEELRRAGFREDQIGVASREMPPDASPAVDEATAVGEGAIAGALAGAGVGGLWAIGIASGLLPAIGPVIAGGLLASVLASAAGGAAIAGLAGALIGLGVSEEEAQYYDNAFQVGRTIVSVRAPGRADEAVAILRLYGAYDMVSRRAEERANT